MTTIQTPSAAQPAVLAKLSRLDRFLPVWIIAAMAVGLLLGRTISGLSTGLNAVKIGSVSLPIAIGLLVMMYPVLAKVRYNETRRSPGGHQLRVPGPRVRRTGLVLPPGPAEIALPGHYLRGFLHRGDHLVCPGVPRNPPRRRIPDPHHR